MKISELIAELQRAKELVGDVEVTVSDDGELRKAAVFSDDDEQLLYNGTVCL